jgi:hypothetical protein
MAISDKIRELDEQVAQAVRRAVDDLREEVRRRLDEANSELQRRLGEVAPNLPESFISEEHLRRIAEEAAAPASEALDRARDEGQTEGEAGGRAEAHEALRDAVAEIDRAGSQTQVLEALLSGASRHAGRAAILLLREGRLAGWGAQGFEADTEAVRSLSLAGDEEPWSGIAAGGPAQELSGARCAPLVSQLDSPLPREGAVVPLVLRDRVAAVLYADRPEEGRLDLAALQLLTYVAALALETLAFRQREATATLAAAGAAAAPPEQAPAGEPYEAAADPESAEEEAEAADETWGASPELEEVEVELEEPEPYPAAPHGDALLEAVEEESPPAAATPFDEGVLEESFLEEEAPLEPGVEERFEEEPAAGGALEAAEAAPAETIAWRTEPELEAEEPEPEVEEPEVEEPEVEEPEVEEPEVEEPEVEEPEVEEPEIEEPEIEEPEVEEPPQEATEIGAAEAGELEGRPEAGDVPPPPPAPPGAGGQVAPPEDVEGPGWAFSATRGTVPKDTEAAHDEARRLARLLVSEIQLYNQDQVDEGRRNRDIYERLRDDIDRSRQLYEDRVDDEIRESTDYFYQELVRQLAAGDAKALGI